MEMKKLFRKIHLWLSVPFGIFITLVCFSGAMMVFEKEITERIRPEVYFVDEVKANPLPLDQLMEKVSQALPDGVSVTGVTLSPDPERTWQASLSKPRRASVYVDPYTGDIKGRSGRLPFFDTMFHLHRWLLGASGNDGGVSYGKLVVGISTLALVFILLTGILMWLTNRRKPLKKSLTISFTKGWPRFWHDLHVAGGIYATLFLLALALTGLTWSFSWYRAGFYGLFGASAGTETGRSNQEQVAHGKQADKGHEKQGRNEAHAGHEAHEETRDGHRPSPFAHWQDVYEALVQAHPDYRQLTISSGSASLVPAGRQSLRAGDRYDFDVRSGQITGCTPYAKQDKSVKVRSAVYTVHVGSWGGMLTRILTFLSALLGATLPLTGYYLWIRRLVNKSKRKHPGTEGRASAHEAKQKI